MPKAPKVIKRVPKVTKMVPKVAEVAPNGIQNGPQSSQSDPKVSQVAPKSCPDSGIMAKLAPRASQRPPEGHFWSDFGTILDVFYIFSQNTNSLQK